MKRTFALLGFLVGVLVFASGGARAQDASPVAAPVATPDIPAIIATITDEANSFVFKVKGDLAVPAGDTIQNAMVIKGNATIAGTVEQNLFVVKGDVVVSGTVTDSVTVIRGTLTLENGSTVGDVTLIDSTLVRADGATVTGSVDDRGYDFSFGRGFAIFSALWWIGMTILALVAAAIFGWLGRAQLYGSVGTLQSEFVKSLLTTVVMWILLPLGAALILFTLIGAPLGLLIIFVVLPVLWLLGSIVVGAWIGSYILKPTDTGRAIGAAVLGTLILSLLSLIPFVAFITGIAALLGSGAFVYRALAHRHTPPRVGQLQPVA